MHFIKITSFIISTIAFTFSMVATFSAEWFVVYHQGHKYGSAGLFQICAEDDCIINNDHLLNTHGERVVLVFSAFSIFSYFLSVILSGLGMLKDWNKCTKIGGGFALFGALLILIATAVYTAEHQTESANREFWYSYGYSYALAWVSVIFGVVGGILAFIEEKEGQMIIGKKLHLPSMTSSSTSDV